jgi:hypothetical protein
VFRKKLNNSFREEDMNKDRPNTINTLKNVLVKDKNRLFVYELTRQANQNVAIILFFVEFWFDFLPISLLRKEWLPGKKINLRIK